MFYSQFNCPCSIPILKKELNQRERGLLGFELLSPRPICHHSSEHLYRAFEVPAWLFSRERKQGAGTGTAFQRFAGRRWKLAQVVLYQKYMLCLYCPAPTKLISTSAAGIAETHQGTVSRGPVFLVPICHLHHGCPPKKSIGASLQKRRPNSAVPDIGGC